MKEQSGLNLLSRRDILKLAGVTASTMFIVSCDPAQNKENGNLTLSVFSKKRSLDRKDGVTPTIQYHTKTNEATPTAQNDSTRKISFSQSVATAEAERSNYQDNLHKNTLPEILSVPVVENNLQHLYSLAFGGGQLNNFDYREILPIIGGGDLSKFYPSLSGNITYEMIKNEVVPAFVKKRIEIPSNYDLFNANNGEKMNFHEFRISDMKITIPYSKDPITIGLSLYFILDRLYRTSRSLEIITGYDYPKGILVKDQGKIIKLGNKEYYNLLMSIVSPDDLSVVSTNGALIESAVVLKNLESRGIKFKEGNELLFEIAATKEWLDSKHSFFKGKNGSYTLKYNEWESVEGKNNLILSLEAIRKNK